MLGSVSSLLGQRMKVISSPSLLTNPQVRMAHRSLPKPRPRVKINLDGELNINTGTRSWKRRFCSHTNTPPFRIDSLALFPLALAVKCSWPPLVWILRHFLVLHLRLLPFEVRIIGYEVADLLLPLPSLCLSPLALPS